MDDPHNNNDTTAAAAEDAVPRHQRKRPAMLSMDLVDTPVAEPSPVVGSMTHDNDDDGARVGEVRMVSEKPPSVYTKLKKKVTGMKGKKRAGGGSLSPSSSSSSPSSSPGRTPPRQGGKDSSVRVSSPLAKESTHTTKKTGSGGSSLRKKSSSSPLADADLHDLSLDHSKSPRQEEEAAYDEESKEEACFSPKMGAGAGGRAGHSVFRPLSPLVLPMLRSPRMRTMLGAENVDKVATLFEGSSTATHNNNSEGNKTPFSSSSSPSRATTLSPVVAPTPVRADASMVLPVPPPPTAVSFAYVEPFVPASVQAQITAQARMSSASLSSSSSSSSSSTSQNFTVALGLCLVACGLIQAGLEWHTMAIGSDYSTWWAGLTCAVLGLATLLAQKRGARMHIPAFSTPASTLLHLLYGLLALGGVAAVVAALFFDLKLLGRLEQADMCGASGDKMVMDNGLVLSETLGNACGFSAGCACVQFTHPLAAGDVACMNFPRSSAGMCPNLPFAVAGLVRISVWLIGGLLFFMSVLMLRTRGLVGGDTAGGGRGGGGGGLQHRRFSELQRPETVVSSFGSSKVRSMSEANRRRMSTEQPPPSLPPPPAPVPTTAAAKKAPWPLQSWWQAEDDADSSDDDDDDDEEEEEDIEGLSAADLAKVRSNRTGGNVAGRGHSLTPIPECATPLPEEVVGGTAHENNAEQVARPRRQDDGIVHI